MHQTCIESSPVLFQSVLVPLLPVKSGSIHRPGGECRIFSNWHYWFVELRWIVLNIYDVYPKLTRNGNCQSGVYHINVGYQNSVEELIEFTDRLWIDMIRDEVTRLCLCLQACGPCIWNKYETNLAYFWTSRGWLVGYLQSVWELLWIKVLFCNARTY